MVTCKDCLHFEVCAYCVPDLPICDSFKERTQYVDVAQIKETKQYILQVIDTLIETDKPLCEWTTDNSYYAGKLAAFEITRRLVNAALTDLCWEE